MKILNDEGDTVQIECDCGEVFVVDAFGENTTVIGGVQYPRCPACGYIAHKE